MPFVTVKENVFFWDYFNSFEEFWWLTGSKKFSYEKGQSPIECGCNDLVGVFNAAAFIKHHLPLIDVFIPLTSGEKSSDIISQGMGPKPTEKAMINKHKLANGKKDSFSGANPGWSNIQK